MRDDPAACIPERPGKTSGWLSFPAASAASTAAGHGWTPGAGRDAAAAAGSLDPLREVFWQSYRHLFPPHALAAQTGSGALVISWSVQDDPHASYPYAAPVMLRFDQQLLEAMAHCDERQRRRIARHHEPELRNGLRGYDPYARYPGARVVVIG